MIYGRSYEGVKSECPACGHVTNVHAACSRCSNHICEDCELDSGGGHYCSRECREADCEHLDLRSEVFGDVHEEVGYRSYYEVWTCRDCGARIDEDGEVINRRAA
jgi:hypothetical protein